MLGDIGIVAGLLGEVVALNYESANLDKLPMLCVFQATLQLTLKCLRNLPLKQSVSWLFCGAFFAIVNAYTGLCFLYQAEDLFTTGILLSLVYLLAILDSMPPIHLHFGSIGLMTYFVLQVMSVMLSTEVLCNYVSFDTVVLFLPTFIMYQSYDLAQEITMMQVNTSMPTLATAFGRYEALSFTITINFIAYLFIIVDFFSTSFWRGLPVLLLPMLIKATYYYRNFKLDLIATQYLLFYWLFTAVSILSFRLSVV